MRFLFFLLSFCLSTICLNTIAPLQAAEVEAAVNAKTLRGKAMCGYQGWFRCPGDAAQMGWIHWSRDARRLAPDTLSFEMWPDMQEYSAAEKFAASGFTYPDGHTAELFSSDNALTVERHFAWMRDYGIDGAWLQHFLVDLPGGSNEARYPSRLRVLRHVEAASSKTGRVWALSYDIAGTPVENIFDLLITDWKKLVDDGATKGPRYLHENGLPVVQIWGFYYQNGSNAMTPELANRLIDFFQTPGPYQAYLVGGGDWDWRTKPDADWQKFYRRFQAYAPWNVGNWAKDAVGQKQASMSWWADDKRVCEKNGVLWMPTIYPGFSWDNIKQQAPGSSTISRRGGQFFWEQFYEVSKLKPDAIYIAMFDEVDEGTAIFKVTNTPPTQAHFVGYEGLPSDWYLRLAGEGVRMWRGQRPLTATIPLKP